MVSVVDVIHDECPNMEHCSHDEEKCMYLVNRKCLINEFKKKGELL